MTVPPITLGQVALIIGFGVVGAIVSRLAGRDDPDPRRIKKEHHE